MDWKKHGFGPGTNTCCRCLGEKESNRFGSKWCDTCNTEMTSRRSSGALDQPRGTKKTARVNIVRNN